eukprot:2667036-Ditylum_brightwellii.AAC.1
MRGNTSVLVKKQHFESSRKALCINNSDGLDGRDVCGYRFNIDGNVLPINFECTTLLWPSRF